MKLEELVPPLDLCKLIPKGEFKDSYFVWKVGKPLYNGGKVYIDIGTRSCPLTDIQQIPAPTLEEIMAKLPHCACVIGYLGWSASSHYVDNNFPKFASNGVTAVFKQWLKWKGIEYEQ